MRISTITHYFTTRILFLFLCLGDQCRVFGLHDASLYERLEEVVYDLQVLKSMTEPGLKQFEDNTLYEKMQLFHEGRLVTCFLPKQEGSGDTSKEQDAGTDVEEVLEPLKRNCLVRNSGWWSYEFCYGEHVRQYHEDEKGKLGVEYFLGYANNNESKKYNDFVSLYYEEGTQCDLTQGSRSIEIRIQCSPEQFSVISDIKEVSTCQYILSVDTPLLCYHPKYKPKKAHTELITCLDASRSEVQKPVIKKHEPIAKPNKELYKTILYPIANGHCSGGEGMGNHFTPGVSLQARNSIHPNGRWKVFLKFDISSLKLETLQQAWLILKPLSVSDIIKQQKGEIEIKMIGNDWSEDELTWLNRPKKGDALEAHHPTENTEHRILLTDHIALALGKNEKFFSLSITVKPSAGDRGTVRFCTKNDPDKSCVPQIEILT